MIYDLGFHKPQHEAGFFFRGPVGLDVAPGMPHIEIDEDVRQERPKLAGNHRNGN